jgi:ArsR family transcriptional regulator, arsenate/arsenite/antimonite-responsive transcriptional repressor
VKLKSEAHYRARAQVAKAMGHPSRMLMLDVLRQKELCVCELAELVGADQSTVSRHLTILKQAGLVDDRKAGATVYHRLRVACLEGFFQCIESVLTTTLERQQSAIH